jgi:hypothetical protein
MSETRVESRDQRMKSIERRVQIESGECRAESAKARDLSAGPLHRLHVLKHDLEGFLGHLCCVVVCDIVLVLSRGS